MGDSVLPVSARRKGTLRFLATQKRLLYPVLFLQVVCEPQPYVHFIPVDVVYATRTMSVYCTGCTLTVSL